MQQPVLPPTGPYYDPERHLNPLPIPSGLVSINSMAWGSFLGVLKPKSKQGISHGDVIDLTRKNIEGFDVCEFYVDLVNKLKLKGM
ncbi:hypothetical protein [Clostridium sp. Marseille-P2415]|uniref:hypothetical protein n=1 Tax=Clostridium sp. Marseille-P2415 TaxID=1805471 RepID=UPI00098851A9|nr:hypothetical protein [Clostridium sp. Marseille-P2415]